MSNLEFLDELFRHSPTIHDAIIKDAQKWWAAVEAKSKQEGSPA